MSIAPRRSLATMAAPIVTILILTALLAALLLGLNYDARLRAAQASVETRAALTVLLSTVQDAETGQRGYLMTGEDRYLAPYEQAVDVLPRRLEQVRVRVAGDAEQERLLADVRGRVSTKMRELETTVVLRRAGDARSALARVRSGDGLQEMIAIRRGIDDLQARAALVAAQRQASASRLGWVLVAVLSLALLAIPLLLRRVSRDIRTFVARNARSLEDRRIETERLGREAVLRDVELSGVNDRFDLVLDAATEFGIVISDAEGLVTRWSRGAEGVFGWSAEHALGRHVRFFFTPEDVAANVPEAEMSVARSAGFAKDERWHLHEDGSRFWASGELQPVLTPDGTLSGYVKIVRDRTDERLAMEAERNRAAMLAARVDAQAVELETAHSGQRDEVQRREIAEGQVRQLQKLEGLGQLTAGIAHDFNNMLAVVIGSLDLIRRKYGSGDAAAGLLRLVSAAEDGAGRAAELTKRLLAFSRQQPLQPAVLDLNRLVGGMSEILRRTLGERVEVETVLAGGLWSVNADPHEIERVLLNLAVNGRDAMPDGGRLTVETANAHLDDGYAAEHPEVAPGQYVAICVTDTGSGMAPDVLAKAFDPFFSTKAVGTGTGLGLSQVYGFAKQSSGHAKIYSELGHGTTVRLYLPRWHGAERPTSPGKVAPSATVLPTGRANEIVLVVEDDERVRMISVETLRDLGYTVRHAANGADALAMMDEQPGIALLFTDIVMPGMTGRQLADAALSRQPGLMTLFTTGYTRNAVVHGGVLDAGVAFLPKPFTVEQLATKVRATIDGRGANR
ncbi:CHASE3 domain-containing protein [Sphingomonas sp.]|uniref:CHASE3 domain-containing protein n=1 Tax=Sphingomonas sp. TaxID=28214 RepID=UPI0035BC4617